jgi:hypothetical protein
VYVYHEGQKRKKKDNVAAAVVYNVVPGETTLVWRRNWLSAIDYNG